MKLRRVLSCVMALLLVCSLPLTAFADTWYLDEGNITVNATESGQTVTQGETSQNDDAPVITQKDSSTSTTNTITIQAEENATANVTIQDVNIVNSDPVDAPQNHSGEAAVTIDVADGAEANVTLDGVNIDVGGTGNGRKSISGEAAVQITGNGDVTLELDGENTLQSGGNRAGVEKDDSTGTGKLTITDENETQGSLEATGGWGGSGIGGGCLSNGSNITITGSAEVTAQGGFSGSGIGGGHYGSGSNITIEGSAEVTAQGGYGGSGIGGGWYGDGSNITITGSAEVIANGGQNASGIGGGGGRGSGSDITISGSAEVTATGGQTGSGIGGGNQGDGSNITITGSAEVTAEGGREGSGIGGGASGSGSNIIITGSAEVTAKGGVSGSGIGGGSNGNGNGTGSDITVSGDVQVKAQGGNQYTILGQNYRGAGAAIGNGGEHMYGAEPNPGDDVAPNTDDLNEGWIAKYAPGADMDSATPNSVTYKGETGVTTSENVTLVPEKAPTCIEEGHTAGFQCGNDQVGVETLQTVDHSYGDFASDNNATCTSDGTKTRKCIWCGLKDTVPDPGSKLVREETAQPLYRVVGQDGKALDCKEARKDGVLTITAEADFASLTGTFSGLKALKAQGIDTIVVVTKGATSTFALSDLLAQGGDGYTLTHDGEKVSFTLSSGEDIGKILK